MAPPRPGAVKSERKNHPFPSRPAQPRLGWKVKANDIWAFGLQLKGPFGEHWDGTSWSIVPRPSGISVIAGATALTDGTIVAVGEGTNGSAVIMHN